MEMDLIIQRDFFISYTSADARWAEWIAWQLEEAGYSVILQAWDFRPGANFVAEMDRAISNVKRTLAVLSPQYLNALYTQPEWAAAFKQDPKGEQGILIPVRVEECELKGLLGQIIYVDLVGLDEGSASKILLKGVRHERTKPEMAPAFPVRVQHTVSKRLSFPGDLPSIWNVPYPRDPLFVGREQVLQELHTVFHTKHQAALTSSLAGSDFSTVGVAETAVEYVYRYQSDYHAILWVHARSRQTLLSDYLEIASLLNVPEKHALEQDEVVHAVKRWLETHSHWLLVFEDVQDSEMIKAFIPSLNRGALLLTTRVPSVSHLFPRIEMERLKPEEQTLLLQLTRIVGAILRSTQKQMPLGIERVTIGRAQDNQIVLSDSAVSSHHAEIQLKEQGYWITDLGSTNGTFVNQQVLDRHIPYLLHPQDVIRISNSLFTYEVTDTASSKLPVSPNPAEVRTTSEQDGLLSAFNEANSGEHVGKQLGNYRLVRLIGQGAFAEVYLAEHIHLDTHAAIKVLYTKLAKDDIETFRQEARTIARLIHPHIVRVLDFGVEGTTPFLVMDYAPGDTLRQLHPKGSRLPLETVVSYVKQVADALYYAHEQKVIHRDVKPENVLMGRHGEVLLSDFGIALITQSSRYENVMDIAGTIAYMAPEQIEAHPLPASDQYSLGIVTYEWLTGDRPFQGSFREIAIKHSVKSPPSLIEQVPTLPPAIEQVVLIALAKDPKQRFGSVLAFATALEQASTVKQLEPEPVFQVSESTDANQSSQPEMASPSVPLSRQDLEGEVSADIPPQPQTTAPLSGKERLDQAEEEGLRQTEEERIRHVEETTVPPIVMPESTPAPSVPEPINATEAASSPSTSPDVSGISSSAISVVPSLRDIWRSNKPVVIGVLLVLVLLSGIIGGVIYAANTINRATATDAINSTIAQTNARNIAQLDPALVASNPDPYPPTNGKLTLYDPMHDNTNQGFGWQENNDCHFTGTAYQVNNTGTCSANNLQLNNFAFETEVDFTKSSYQGADVFFREVYSPDTWYAFTIYNNRTYDFEAGATNLLGGRVTPILLTAIQSDAIHQGAQTNIIAIVANGSTIDLYANGVKLNSFNDSSSNYGGMFLASVSSPVNFRNAKLWTF